MDQTINVGAETITTRDVSLVWKVLCVIGVLTGPILSFYLSSSHEDTDLKITIASHNLMIGALQKQVEKLERENMFMRNRLMGSGPFPGVTPR